MEFNNIVNMYLKRDPEARDRNLFIKTYVSINLFFYSQKVKSEFIMIKNSIY